VLADAGVPCGPVNTLPEALADQQVQARGMLLDVPHEDFGIIRQVASPVRAGTERVAPRRAPRRNEDADYVLRRLLGYDDERVEFLTAAGAFGM